MSGLIGLALAAAVHTSAQAQSKKEGERLLREQQQTWGVSCKEVHPKAHQFVANHVTALASRPTVGAPLEERFIGIAKETAELSDQTLQCYGLEPIARHSGLAFEADFGELHEVLRHARELIDSFRSGEPDVARSFRLKELQKRMQELKTGTGRRYPARA